MNGTVTIVQPSGKKPPEEPSTRADRAIGIGLLASGLVMGGVAMQDDEPIGTVILAAAFIWFGAWVIAKAWWKE